MAKLGSFLLHSLCAKKSSCEQNFLFFLKLTSLGKRNSLDDFFDDVAKSLSCSLDDLDIHTWKPKLCRTIEDLMDLRNGSDWPTLKIDSTVKSRIVALLNSKLAGTPFLPLYK